MNHVLQMRPIALAVCTALATAAHAQVFDPNSAAVRQAYVGVATQEKKDAALAGLTVLANQVWQSVTYGSNVTGNLSGSYYQTISGNIHDSFRLTAISGFTPSVTIIQASNSSELPVPGPNGAVSLDNVVLRALASFNTSRDVVVGSTGAVIDTNGFNLAITGNVTANGPLAKDGLGTLVLTGNNAWGSPLWILKGVVEGNSTSLPSVIINHGTVRFNQTVDGVAGVITTSFPGWVIPDIVLANPLYAGTPMSRSNLEKTGPGTLFLSGPYAVNGNTTILEGTLALRGGSINTDRTGVHVAQGATFDIHSVSFGSPDSVNVGLLSGAGNILLGNNFVTVSADGDSTFSGVISGGGALNKTSSGTLTLTGINTYEGRSTINKGVLALVGLGQLSPQSTLVLQGGHLDGGTLDISAADGDREFGSLGGGGAIHLGANTLIVGRNNQSNPFFGVITGSGGLTKNGTGYFDLAGANTFTGVTTVNQGNLIAETRSISNTVVNNATLTFREYFSPASPINTFRHYQRHRPTHQTRRWHHLAAWPQHLHRRHRSTRRRTDRQHRQPAR